MLVDSVVKKDFICSDLFCNKRFSTRYARKRHMLSAHSKTYRFKCNICKKVFRDAYSLKRHRKLSHNSSLNYKCVFCDYKSQRAYNLERHCEKYHGDESSYDGGTGLKCTVCQRMFLSRFRLNNHMGLKETFPSQLKNQTQFDQLIYLFFLV